jgi:hypothetical protein
VTTPSTDRCPSTTGIPRDECMLCPTSVDGAHHCDRPRNHTITAPYPQALTHACTCGRRWSNTTPIEDEPPSGWKRSPAA